MVTTTEYTNRSTNDYRGGYDRSELPANPPIYPALCRCLNTDRIRSALSRADISECLHQTDYTLNWPYRVNKAQTGFKRIDPAPSNQRTTDDPFDRSEEEMRRWLQGIVWREAHFRGMPIMQIAKKEGLSATHVQRCIMRSLTINGIGPL